MNYRAYERLDEPGAGFLGVVGALAVVSNGSLNVCGNVLRLGLWRWLTARGWEEPRLAVLGYLLQPVGR